jgi:hypothetical protein
VTIGRYCDDDRRREVESTGATGTARLGGRSEQMQIGLIRVDQTTLNEMPEAERRAFFAFGFLANEITCLQRLSYWCVVETACSSDIEYEARTSQVFFLMRIKIGKLKEAHNSLKKFYFDSCLSKKYNDKLDPAARDALKTFKRALDRTSHAFNEIRSKISFHADCESLYAMPLQEYHMALICASMLVNVEPTGYGNMPK